MKKTNAIICSLLLLSVCLPGCRAHDPLKKDATLPPVTLSQANDPEAASDSSAKKTEEDDAGYQLRKLDIEMKEGRPYLPVGAELVTDKGQVPLNAVIKKLVALKGFSVSWADDVNQEQAVSVNIRPEDDFWAALNNVLRQLDYCYEERDGAILINYKVTRTYHIAMPFLQENFTTSVGGDLLGGELSEDKMKGEITVEGMMAEPLDFWKGVDANITNIIGDRGSFVIDRPVGLITVTAPLNTQAKILDYVENLKAEIHKQIIIEAKIVEVRLDEKSEKGIDWSNVFGKRSFEGDITYGNIYPNKGVKFIQSVTLDPQDFKVVMSALETYGDTKVISNPKITLLNGHGANITVGENITYVSKVESTVDTETNVITYDVTTDTVLSGMGLGVMVNIIDDQNMVLYIVPITSELKEPMETEQFGKTDKTDGAKVGLPRIKLRDLSTIARVKDGETLIIGGLIDKVVEKDEIKVPVLGDLPYLGRLFKYNVEETITRELVILLKPRIIMAEATE
jgi:general secretion pathway protein D/MSHA biogenesis protein MshL